LKPSAYFYGWSFEVLGRQLSPLARTDFSSPGGAFWANPHMGILALFLGLSLLIGIPAIIWIAFKIARFIRVRREKSIIEEMIYNARRSEEAGEFVSAAFMHEKLKNFEKAAALYEKGGDFSRAATLYGEMGLLEKGREMYEKAGDPEKAAEACKAIGDFIGAARIYSELGDKISAARAFEKAGNRIAAVRAYREARDYVKASMLLKEEGMLKESADMYKLSLAENIQPSTLDQYYAYARLLQEAGEKDKARTTFRDILSLDTRFMDVKERLDSLAPEDAEDAGTLGAAPAGQRGRDEGPLSGPAGSGTLLRQIMKGGRTEPRYSFRLWVQMLKALKQEYGGRIFPGNLSPESIYIDAANNVSFDETIPWSLAYKAPETTPGESPDIISAIYTMGVILYEMVTGGLDSLGVKRPSEVQPDVPPWLEELMLKCIDKNRSQRYQSIEDIFSSLKALKTTL